jgi:hypothetical protein
MYKAVTVMTFSALIAVSGYQAQNQATAKPDKASIELWLNNRLSQQLNVLVEFGATEDFNEEHFSHHNSFEYSVKLQAFSVADCNLKATYIVGRSFHGASTQRTYGQIQYRDETHSVRETVTLNLHDLQPSKIMSDQWTPWKAPKRTDSDGTVITTTYACSSASGCSVPAVFFTVTGSQIQYEDSDNVSRMEQHDLIPIGARGRQRTSGKPWHLSC